ncbi:uncharacterized protein LOC111006869 isoform X2 [Momordica charantia]|uniref:Uncharacterized protein LOC111006869 isoform X2 n=1 Tax=Momordica charantia TaxID=3673 RepID=A0A6J1C2M2_MOMCH|nr:uncharacterized protein LOC111006869 isoform X2 [Momordica charantia]
MAMFRGSGTLVSREDIYCFDSERRRGQIHFYILKVRLLVSVGIILMTKVIGCAFSTSLFPVTKVENRAQNPLLRVLETGKKPYSGPGESAASPAPWS